MGFESESGETSCEDVEVSKLENNEFQGKVHTCPYAGCERVFKRPYRLNAHICTHTGERPFKCKFRGCVKTYSNSSHLRRHVAANHKAPGLYKTTYKCPYKGCFMELSNEQNLRRHYNRKHEKEFPFNCTVCSKGFLKRSQLQRHNSEHTGIPVFKCTKCSLGFKYVRDYNRHLRGHKTHKCDYCEEIFDVWSLLRKHVKLFHPGEFICDVCKKSFMQKCRLKEHMQVHEMAENKEIIPCPFKNCPRFYFQKKNLDHHIKSSHEGVKHECTFPDCGRKLNSKITLQKHMKLHASNRPLPRPRKPRKTRCDAGKRKQKQNMASILTAMCIPSEDNGELSGEVSPNVEVTKIALISSEDESPFLGFTSNDKAVDKESDMSLREVQSDGNEESKVTVPENTELPTGLCEMDPVVGESVLENLNEYVRTSLNGLRSVVDDIGVSNGNFNNRNTEMEEDSTTTTRNRLLHLNHGNNLSQVQANGSEICDEQYALYLNNLKNTLAKIQINSSQMDLSDVELHYNSKSKNVSCTVSRSESPVENEAVGMSKLVSDSEDREKNGIPLQTKKRSEIVLTHSQIPPPDSSSSICNGVDDTITHLTKDDIAEPFSEGVGFYIRDKVTNKIISLILPLEPCTSDKSVNLNDSATIFPEIVTQQKIGGASSADAALQESKCKEVNTEIRDRGNELQEEERVTTESAAMSEEINENKKMVEDGFITSIPISNLICASEGSKEKDVSVKSNYKYVLDVNEECKNRVVEFGNSKFVYTLLNLESKYRNNSNGVSKIQLLKWERKLIKNIKKRYSNLHSALSNKRDVKRQFNLYSRSFTASPITKLKGEDAVEFVKAQEVKVTQKEDYKCSSKSSEFIENTSLVVISTRSVNIQVEDSKNDSGSSEDSKLNVKSTNKQEKSENGVGLFHCAKAARLIEESSEGPELSMINKDIESDINSCESSLSSPSSSDVSRKSEGKYAVSDQNYKNPVNLQCEDRKNVYVEDSESPKASSNYTYCKLETRAPEVQNNKWGRKLLKSIKRRYLYLHKAFSYRREIEKKINKCNTSQSISNTSTLIGYSIKKLAKVQVPHTIDLNNETITVLSKCKKYSSNIASLSTDQLSCIVRMKNIEDTSKPSPKNMCMLVNAVNTHQNKQMEENSKHFNTSLDFVSSKFRKSVLDIQNYKLNRKLLKSIKRRYSYLNNVSFMRRQVKRCTRSQNSSNVTRVKKTFCKVPLKIEASPVIIDIDSESDDSSSDCVEVASYNVSKRKLRKMDVCERRRKFLLERNSGRMDPLERRRCEELLKKLNFYDFQMNIKKWLYFMKRVMVEMLPSLERPKTVILSDSESY